MEPPLAGPPKTSGAAVASLVLGAFSLFCSCFTALPGVICGFVALSHIGKSNGRLKGRGLAILGIVLSLLLTVVGAVMFMVSGSKKLAEIPELREVFGALPTMTEASTQALEIAAALKAHANANDGRLPATLDELVTAGRIDAATLQHPADQSPGFWRLEPPDGTRLADLPPKTVVVRSAPIKVVDQRLEMVIFANGEVKPQEVSSSPDPGGESPADRDPAAGAPPADPDDTASPNPPER
jgi:hypothetical protein